MRLLPTLLLAGCTRVNSNLPEDMESRCAPEIQAVIDTCRIADVIGTNDNAELYRVVEKAKQCFKEDVRVVCGDTDSFKIVTFNIN